MTNPLYPSKHSNRVRAVLREMQVLVIGFSIGIAVGTWWSVDAICRIWNTATGKGGRKDAL
jgi:Na+-driven multidrug efflux pump